MEYLVSILRHLRPRTPLSLYHDFQNPIRKELPHFSEMKILNYSPNAREGPGGLLSVRLYTAIRQIIHALPCQLQLCFPSS